MPMCHRKHENLYYKYCSSANKNITNNIPSLLGSCSHLWFLLHTDCTLLHKTRYFCISGPYGMDFYLIFLENVGDDVNPGHLDQLNVMIAPQAPGWVVLEAPEINLFENRTVTDNGTVFSLSHTLRLTNDTRIEKKGIHVYSSVNISVYAYDAKYNNREAYYVLPAEALSTEYIAMSYHPLNWKSLVGILATRDHTVVNVTLNSTGIVHYRGVTLGKGATFTLHLDKLYTYQVTSHSDLTGTMIESNYPIVVVSGDQCAIGTDYNFCQPLYEEMIPPSKWGKQFLIPPLNMISSLYTIRIASQQNNTQITIRGNHIAEHRYFMANGSELSFVTRRRCMSRSYGRLPGCM